MANECCWGCVYEPIEKGLDPCVKCGSPHNYYKDSRGSYILDALYDADVIKSFGEGRRHINNGAVKVNGEKQDSNAAVNNGDIISVGKRIKITV